MNYFLVHCSETGDPYRNPNGEVKNTLLGEFESTSDAISQAEVQFDLKHIHRGVFGETDKGLVVLMDAQEFSEL